MVTVIPQGAVSKRFLFNSDIDEQADVSEVVVPPEPTISVAEHERIVKAAEEAAFQRGRLDAQQAIEAKEAQSSATQLQHLNGRLEHLLARLDQELKAQDERLASMAMLIARRLCGHLVEEYPLGEVEALLAECLAPLRKTPQILVEVPAEDAEALNEKLEHLILNHSFEGKVHVVKSAGMARGDCRIEWPEGGIVRDQQKAIEHIEAAMSSHFLARKTAGN